MFVYIHALCTLTEKALASLEPSFTDNSIVSPYINQMMRKYCRNGLDGHFNFWYQYFRRLCYDIHPVQGCSSWADLEKNDKSIGFLSNTGPDPLKNHKATKPTFNVGPSSARQRNAISMAFVVNINPNIQYLICEHKELHAHVSARILEKCISHARIQRGAGVWTPQPPRKKHTKNIWLLSNTGQDPLKNHKATKPAFNVGLSSARL